MNQFIATVEFALGSVSNVASYLRLWALSLAHCELSSVFLQYTLMRTVTSHGSMFRSLIITAEFAVFASVSVGILLCLDSLECFLHTLRLHWVEFQNKFFAGDGYLYCPFSYRTKPDN
eukprot:TRINITY_DN10574_c0_g1_i3.p2 TRINITY_DN10574_c0_g1~~TRINITY_DN10574_c0_g1_i3.p2  ORF type:complete len:118 (+),score=9.61 TRINITY_DN10574_c0_g1_i3:185-538(+)